VLLELCSASPLQAFAAGAALCSTSLGTTFTVLESTGLTTSRLGTILMNAAMLDDIVGLIMIRIISILGDTGSMDAITILRPIIVSFSLVAFLLLLCRFALLPLNKFWLNRASRENGRVLKSIAQSKYPPFIFQSALLTALVSVGSYAGTSSLFSAYLAGSLVSWWDGETFHHHELASGGAVELQTALPEQEAVTGVLRSEQNGSKTSSRRMRNEGNFNPNLQGNNKQVPSGTGKAVYAAFYLQPVDRLLKPFFFVSLTTLWGGFSLIDLQASIGFCIPISAMFHPPNIWRGLLYALLMILAKLATGLWVVSLPSKHASTPKPAFLPTQSHHLVPPLILGSAMVARGEIGFLIAGLAEGTGVFTPEIGVSGNVASNSPSQIYLVVIWAIVMCTILGPITVGYLVRRVNGQPGDMERETT
jgi:Kef-type K+ transport system membrane component KefB